MSNFKKNSSKQEETQKATFGHPELDALLDNSLMKGQIIFIEQDAPTTIYQQFLRCSLGHSYHQQQVSIIFDDTPQRWLKMIPQIQIEKKESQQLQQQQDHKIAWRYKNMENHYNIKNIDQKILKFDLSKEQQIKEEKWFILQEYQQNVKELLEQIKNAYAKSLKSSTDSSLKKLILEDMLTYIKEDDLLEFLYALKVLVRSSFMLCIVTIPNQFENKSLLYPFCDFYISITQIFGNKEFSDFQGFLKIEKVGSGGCLKQTMLDMDKWGIKVTQKSVTIEMLYETAVEEESDQDEKKEKLQPKACGVGKSKDQFEF